MATYKNILYEKQRKGVLITMNRPDTLNAINPAMEAEIHQALDEAVADPEIRAVVLTGAGRAFSPGYDIGASREFVWPYGLPEGTSSAEWIDFMRGRDEQSRRRYLLHLWELSKPVIAAVNGWCMGGASWYAIASHLTFASEEAVFSQPEVRHMDDTNFFWVLAAGYKNALRYALTGDHIDAQEALRIGIVNAVVPPDKLLDECFTLVERIAKLAPETVKTALYVATRGLEMMGLVQALILNHELTSIIHSSKRQDFRKHLDDAMKEGGLRAFLKARDDPFRPEPFGPRSRPAG